MRPRNRSSRLDASSRALPSGAEAINNDVLKWLRQGVLWLMIKSSDGGDAFKTRRVGSSQNDSSR